MDLLNQLREDASRLVDEAAPEVVNALEHIGKTDTLTRLFVALLGRLSEAIPGIVYPSEDKPLPSAVVTHTPTDEEATEAAIVSPNPAAPSVTSLPVQAQPSEQSKMEDLERKLKVEESKVSALQASITPNPQAAPSITAQTSQGSNP